MKIRIIGYVVSLLSVVSCTKFLDQKPDQKLVVPEKVSDLQAILDNSSLMNDMSPSLDESSTDDYWLPEATYSAFPDFYRHVYVWQSTQADHTSHPNDWSRMYDAVYYCNVALDNLPKMERTPSNAAEWDNVKGSALFFRSWWFLKIAGIYAKAYNNETAETDKGIVLRLTSDFNMKSVRSTVGQTYNRIIEDLKEAIPLLPVTPVHVMRPSKPAAYALLARTFLNMRMYDQALLYADSSLQIRNELLNYNEITNTSSNTPFSRFNKEVIFNARVGAYAFALASPSNAKVDTLLIQQYEPNDLRLKLFFRTPTERNQYRFKGNYDATISNLFAGIAADEVYLVRAECKARMGDLPGARSSLDSLLIKRYKQGEYIPITIASSLELLAVILKERRKELLFRGLRFTDIKRLNLEGAAITPRRLIDGREYSIIPNSSGYALPIPQQVIEQSGIDQN